jgi:hypothetical protein
VTLTVPRIRIGPRALVVLLVSFAALFAAPAANAATVGFNYYYGTLYYVAAIGEANNVTITGDSAGYQVTDAGATLSAQFGCTLSDTHHATCSGKYVRWLYVKTGDGDDTLSLQSMTSAFVDCGDGTDTLNTPNTLAKVSYCELVNAPAATTPPATTPPPAAVTPPALTIGQPVATMSTGGEVPLTLACSATAASRCTGTITFSLPKKASKSDVGMARRGAPNILGKDKFSVAQGKRRKVKISMTGKGRGMVKHRGKLRVTATLKIKQGGATTSSTQSLTIKAPRRHHR